MLAVCTPGGHGSGDEGWRTPAMAEIYRPFESADDLDWSFHDAGANTFLNPIECRAATLDAGVLPGELDDVGDVDGLLEEAGDRRDGEADIDVAAAAKVRGADEGVTAGGEPIAFITVMTDAVTGGGREWCPADMVTAVAPGNPRRSPLAARNPKPAVAGDLHPAPIMVTSPTKRLIGVPSPTLIGADPASIQIRPPGRALGRIRAESVTVAIDLHPAAIGAEGVVKHAVIRWGVIIPRL